MSKIDAAEARIAELEAAAKVIGRHRCGHARRRWEVSDNVGDITDEQLDHILERFDQTEPRLQRRLVGQLVLKGLLLEEENEEMRKLLDAFAKLSDAYPSSEHDDRVLAVFLGPCRAARRFLEGNS